MIAESSNKIVRIGGASGAWGDSPMAIGQLLTSDVQYLMMDYLAEVTMSLLARARLRVPEAGFPPDFVGYLKPHLAQIASRGIKVVSNAGGVNPQACKRALEAICAEEGIKLSIAVVEGDDLMPMIDELRNQDVREWVSGAKLPSSLLTANAYLGALPIAAALDHGADIVITGRCADSALALGILVHEFGWKSDDYNRLAAGSLVGHLLECGPQATGGVFTDWASVPGWHNIGYPIAECEENGAFVLTKPEGTGGLVTPATAAEQVLYEIGDPSAYILPDVIADFSQVRLVQDGVHRVRFSGATGRSPTHKYKVSATYQEGFRAIAMVSIVGVDAVPKAERVAAALVERAGMLFAQNNLAGFQSVHSEVLGGEANYGQQSKARASREVILRLVVDHADPKALNLFARELGSAGLSFAQGITGLIGGRPKPTPIVKLFTFFIDKSRGPAVTVQLGSEGPFTVPIPTGQSGPEKTSVTNSPVEEAPFEGEGVLISLGKVAHARSGDKGNLSNIAIFSRKPEYLGHLRSVLTPERMAEHFVESVAGPVVRYEVPGLNALNFVLDNALGGGGMASARIDSQGKAYGQRALEMMIVVPKSWNI